MNETRLADIEFALAHNAELKHDDDACYIKLDDDCRALIAEVRRLRDFEDDERITTCDPEELRRLQLKLNAARSRELDILSALNPSKQHNPERKAD